MGSGEIGWKTDLTGYSDEALRKFVEDMNPHVDADKMSPQELDLYELVNAVINFVTMTQMYDFIPPATAQMIKEKTARSIPKQKYL